MIKIKNGNKLHKKSIDRWSYIERCMQTQNHFDCYLRLEARFTTVNQNSHESKHLRIKLESEFHQKKKDLDKIVNKYFLQNKQVNKLGDFFMRR
jgi:gluconate kinase